MSLGRILPREEGQLVAEYAVILGVITLAVVGGFAVLAGGIGGALNAVASAF
jgi:Flp pilus assembly pilin Flp